MHAHGRGEHAADLCLIAAAIIPQNNLGAARQAVVRLFFTFSASARSAFASRLGRVRKRQWVFPESDVADARHQRDFAQEGRAHRLGRPFGAAVTEDMMGKCPQSGHTNTLIFSTMPKIGTEVLRNMAMPLRASIRAIVLRCRKQSPRRATAINAAPWSLLRIACARGISTTSTSSGAQETSFSIGNGAHHHWSAPDHGLP